MASFTSLPVELVTHIVSLVAPRQSLATLRLVNQTLNTICTPFYFSTIPLYPEWDEDEKPDPPFPNHIDYEARYFRNILDSEHLKQLVNKVEIYTCNPDCDHHPHWVHHGGGLHLYGGWMPRPEMSDEWDDVYNRIPEFPKLNGVSLIFDRHAGDGDDNDGEELQGPSTRITNVRRLLHLLGERIQDLSIRHMQLDAWKASRYNNDEGLVTRLAEDLKLKDAVLGGLRALRMSIVHLQPHGESGTVYKVTDCHEQWANFPRLWLDPAANLHSLTLYSDIPVGWFPRIDLRSVFLPQLHILALGQFIFSHDHQFDFITNHASTLKELYLDRCSILYQFGFGLSHSAWLDKEGYPITLPEPGYSILMNQEDPTLSVSSYGTRWHNTFHLFSTSLPHLHTFRFGTSPQWKFDQENRYDDGSEGMPIMPWEAENSLPNRLLKERYMVWDDWGETYISEWRDSTEDTLWDPKTWGKEKFKLFEEYPDCAEEDEVALRKLLAKMSNM